jgi:hypothetical protein
MQSRHDGIVPRAGLIVHRHPIATLEWVNTAGSITSVKRTISLELVMSPGLLLSLSLVAASNAAQQPSRPGTVSRENFDAQVTANARDIGACYEGELRNHPNATGTAQVSLQVGPNGQVQKVEVRSGEALSPELRACLEQEMHKWQFPAQAGQSAATYPLHLVPPHASVSTNAHHNAGAPPPPSHPTTPAAPSAPAARPGHPAAPRGR